ncbi:MAG TPA: sugar phosphate isomerase/epimerase family protein [Candidatus Tumulicola sp.]|jgi:sugar phosphate isomerase/epimerase
MTWTFGISEVTTMPWSFEKDVARYGGLGAQAIEIWEKKLDADPGRRREQLRMPTANGLSVPSFQAGVHALYPTHLKPEPRSFEARLRAFVATLEACASFIPGAVFVLNTGRAKDGDVESAFARTRSAYRELARRAESLGVRLALEPLNPLAMNEDTFVWNLEDSLEILEAVDHPALGICADIWNLAGQYDLQARLAHCAGRIFLAQVSDWRRPRSFLDRLAVGDGTLDFQPFLAGLRDAGYEGPLVLEIFSQNVPDSLYDGDLRAVVTRSREALERHQCNALRANSQQTAPSAAVVR